MFLFSLSWRLGTKIYNTLIWRMFFFLWSSLNFFLVLFLSFFPALLSSLPFAAHILSGRRRKTLKSRGTGQGKSWNFKSSKEFEPWWTFQPTHDTGNDYPYQTKGSFFSVPVHQIIEKLLGLIYGDIYLRRTSSCRKTSVLEEFWDCYGSRESTLRISSFHFSLICCRYFSAWKWDN